MTEDDRIMSSDGGANTDPGPGQTADVTVELNYIDKMYSSLAQQWAAMSRTITLYIVLSFITLAISMGVVTPKETFSLLGLGFRVSIIPALGASAFVIAALHVMGYTLVSRTNDTAVEVARLYKELGYRDKTLSFDNWRVRLSPQVPFLQFCIAVATVAIVRTSAGS